MINQKKQTFIDRSRIFAVSIIRFVHTLPNLPEYKIISDQVIRSSTSIGANVVEAKSASSKKDYINFYTHALKSANETIYWLSLIKELHSSVSAELTQEAEELAKILGSSVITMKEKRNYL
jgi:four helix bundle protein